MLGCDLKEPERFFEDVLGNDSGANATPFVLNSSVESAGSAGSLGSHASKEGAARGGVALAGGVIATMTGAGGASSQAVYRSALKSGVGEVYGGGMLHAGEVPGTLGSPQPQPLMVSIAVGGSGGAASQHQHHHGSTTPSDFLGF